MALRITMTEYLIRQVDLARAVGTTPAALSFHCARGNVQCVREKDALYITASSYAAYAGMDVDDLLLRVKRTGGEIWQRSV